jgi:hypothetical protein
MSSGRVSILAVLAVFLITLPPPAGALIGNSIPDSAALGAATQISPESRSAIGNQGALGYKRATGQRQVGDVKAQVAAVRRAVS